MKRFVTFLIVGILVLSGLGAVALQDENIKVEIKSINFSHPVVNERNEFVKISMPKTNSFLMRQDKPLLPCYTETFTYQIGTIINSVSCIPNDIKQQKISKYIIPTPEAVTAGYSINKDDKQVSSIDYGEDIYPNTWYTYDVGRGRYNNEPCVIVKVQVFPIQYNAAEGVIKWSNKMDIIIEYEEPKESIVFNDNYELIVLGPSEYSDDLAPLISHKVNNMGISTIFVSLTDIYNGVHFSAIGRDNQEKIKYFIKNAIENWGTGYVLLVGGNLILPTRETHVKNNNDVEIFVSDLYYADIYNETDDFCSWDSNGNDVFGEYNWGTSHNYDNVDLYPDVNIGRLACVNNVEVTTSVNKIITYETEKAYTKHWFNDLVVIGGDHAPGDGDACPEGEFVNQKVINIMDGFIPNIVWDSNGRLSGIIPTGVMEINSALNEGCGFIDFAGHGNTNVWATHAYEDDETWIPTPQGYYLNTRIQGLSNGDELPIVIIGACSTCKFNKDPDCFGWSFILNDNGGGIAACGASGLDWFYLGEYVIEKGFEKICIDSFEAYDDGAMTFGEMWSGAINRYIYPDMDDLDHKTVEEFQPFGDPTLTIRENSQAPSKPATPSGPANGNTAATYTYSTSATDPESEQIYYLFDWGDGTYSGWVGPYDSEDQCEASNKWSTAGTFEIKAIAKDTKGVISEWADPLSISITMSRNKPYINTPFLNFLQQYPILYQLLLRFLQL